MRTESEIEDQIGKALESGENGSTLFGMTYEEGVDAALRWVNGDSDEPPIEE